MAIDIQQPNYSGLVAIAGKNAPLNVAPTGALGLQALQQQQANAAALRANNLGRAQLQQQGVLGLLSNQAQQRALTLQEQQQQRQALLAQAEMAQKQQQMGMQGNQFNAEQALKQQQLAQQGALGQSQLDVEKAKMFQEYRKEQLTALMNEKKERIQEKGSFASFAVLAMKGAKSPEEAQMMRTEIIKEGVAKGYYTKEQAQQAMTIPLSQFTALAQSEVINHGMAKEVKDMMDADKEKNKSGTNIEFNEDGSIRSISTDPNSAVKTEVQKKIIAEESLQKNFNILEDQYNPDYFRYGNKLDNWASKESDKLKDTIVGGAAELAASVFTGMTAKQRDAFVQKRATFMNNVNQIFNQYRKEITGAAAAEKELDRLQASFLSGEMAPSEFKGALDLVKSRGLAELEANKQVLREGVNTTSIAEGKRKFLKEHGKTDAEIDEYFKNGGK